MTDPSLTDAELTALEQKHRIIAECGCVDPLVEEESRVLLRLLAAYRALQAEHQWHPIETAPKVAGVPVLLWWPEWHSEPCIGRWDQGYDGRWGSDSEINAHHESQPTHWQPLPAAPGPQSTTLRTDGDGL